jgi:hypothetical protein
MKFEAFLKKIDASIRIKNFKDVEDKLDHLKNMSRIVGS